MPHDFSLIATLAVGFSLALMLGYLALRLRLPPLVGYLVAGILIGPATPGFVADVALAGQLAEIGVMLLMFGVGLHFSLADLLAVRRIAVPGALVQIAVATLMGAAGARLWGWAWPEALVFGLCLSVASTVVLLRALEAQGLLASVNGRIAVGWLVVEDLVMVLVLVLLPVLAGVLAKDAGMNASVLWTSLGLTLAKVLAFVAFMLLVGRRLLPKLLWWIAATGSRELFTLGVIAAALGVAFGAATLFDVSFALGAFFAGMMLRESPFSHKAAAESLPLRDAFAVLFFVSVGMLFDPAVIIAQPLKLLLVVAIVLLGKTLAAVVLVLLFRYPLNTALTVGVSLAQIGEFSFILAGLGLSLGLLSPEAQSLVLAAALVSIALNGALFTLVAPAMRWIRARSRLARRLERPDDPLSALPMSVDPALLSGQVVLVGYGRVGRQVGDVLRQAGCKVVVAEQQRERVDRLRQAGFAAVCGDASQPAVLIQAHIVRAALLVVTVDDSLAARRMVEIARTLNPDVRVLLRADSEDEATRLRADGLGEVLGSRQALAAALSARAIALLGR